MTSPFRRTSILIPALAAALASCAGGSRAPAGGLTVADDWGRTVRLPAPARRIVSLAPASTELVFALGLGERLVGRTTWCDWPPEARRVADVGNGIAPNVEAVAARRPDLVLRLDRADDVRRAALAVSAAAGEPDAGRALVARFDGALRAATRPPPPSPVGVYVDVDANPPITVGAGSYLTEIITAAGGRNVFADIRAGSGPVSLESIVARDPDVVVVLASDTAADPGLASRPGWRAVRAVREGRVLVLDGRLYGRPSPRMPEAVRGLAAKLDGLRGGRGTGDGAR